VEKKKGALSGWGSFTEAVYEASACDSGGRIMKKKKKKNEELSGLLLRHIGQGVELCLFEDKKELKHFQKINAYSDEAYKPHGS